LSTRPALDAIGAESLPAYEASIRVNYPLIANAVMSVDEFLAAAEVGGTAGAAVQAGDTVLGSDHGEIGHVDRVESAGAAGGFLVVPRGLVFAKDTYIPLDAVVKRSGTTVFINVPKLVVGHMPWSEPPSAEAQRAKRGPRRSDVRHLYGSRSPSGRPG
jgi:ureidoacrylate peracid hydrolase